MSSDHILNFQLDHIGVRGRLVRLNETLDMIVKQHDYPEWVGFQLAEALLLNAATGSAIKLQGTLSLQIRSEGTFKLIATDYFAPQGEWKTPRLRGYVKYDADRKDKDNGSENYLRGYYGIIIDQKTGAQPYQGITPINETLTKSAEQYFAQSEQIPTLFHSEIRYDALKESWHGALMMVQRVAGEGGVSERETADDDWGRLEAMMSTLTADEMLDDAISSEALVYRLFHEDNPTAHPPEPIGFGCTCSEERVRHSLSIYSQKDIGHMTTDEGRVTADCQFCGAHYDLDPKTLGFEAE